MKNENQAEIKGYAVEAGELNHNHKRCFHWYSPFVFNWAISIDYGCMGKNIGINKSMGKHSQLAKRVKTIKLL